MPGFARQDTCKPPRPVHRTAEASPAEPFIAAHRYVDQQARSRQLDAPTIAHQATRWMLAQRWLKRPAILHRLAQRRTLSPRVMTNDSQLQKRRRATNARLAVVAPAPPEITRTPSRDCRDVRSAFDAPETIVDVRALHSSRCCSRTKPHRATDAVPSRRSPRLRDEGLPAALATRR
jgi:hypothetical protein